MWFICSLRPAGSTRRACSPPRLAATQLAPSAVLNRLTAPMGLSPTLTPTSRAHQEMLTDPYWLSEPYRLSEKAICNRENI
jgi:heat shock protein HslJ